MKTVIVGRSDTDSENIHTQGDKKGSGDLAFYFNFYYRMSGSNSSRYKDNESSIKLGDGLKFVFSPDIIVCGGLGSKHQITNPKLSIKHEETKTE